MTDCYIPILIAYNEMTESPHTHNDYQNENEYNHTHAGKAGETMNGREKEEATTTTNE